MIYIQRQTEIICKFDTQTFREYMYDIYTATERGYM
jgi:hypothetical protein